MFTQHAQAARRNLRLMRDLAGGSASVLQYDGGGDGRRRVLKSDRVHSHTRQQVYFGSLR
jgi:hypothetical protein